MATPQTLDTELEFEPAGEPEMEIVTLEPGQEVPKEEPKVEEAKPEGVTLTAEQYQELLAGKDSTAALTAGLGQLAETMRQPAQPVNQPQMPGFDPKEIEELAFKPGGFTEAVQKVATQLLGQAQGPLAAGMVQQNKRLLKVDPQTSELFNTYEQEIEKRVRSLPVQYQMQPDIYEQVYKQVVFEKTDEITNKRAQKIAQEAVKEALEAAGIKPDGKAAGASGASQKPAMYQEGSVRPSVPKVTRKVYVTKDDLEDMRERGMDPDDKDQIDTYVRIIKPRRAK